MFSLFPGDILHGIYQKERDAYHALDRYREMLDEFFNIILCASENIDRAIAGSFTPPWSPDVSPIGRPVQFGSDELLRASDRFSVGPIDSIRAFLTRFQRELSTKMKELHDFFDNPPYKDEPYGEAICVTEAAIHVLADKSIAMGRLAALDEIINSYTEEIQAINRAISSRFWCDPPYDLGPFGKVQKPFSQRFWFVDLFEPLEDLQDILVQLLDHLRREQSMPEHVKFLNEQLRS